MSTRTLLFDVDATGSLDGATNFALPVPLPAPNATTGQIIIPVTAATGALGRLNTLDATFGSLVGQGGYFLRSVGVNSQSAAILRLLIGLRQPDPTITIAGATTFQTDPIFVAGATVTDVQGTPFARQGVYVPAGWSLCFFGDNNAGVVQLGPIQVTCEFETLPKTEDAARAIRSQKFPKAPVTLSV